MRVARQEQKPTKLEAEKVEIVFLMKRLWLFIVK